MRTDGVMRGRVTGVRRPGSRSFRLGTIVFALVVAAGSLQNLSAADVAFGQHLANECVTCHRADGQDKGIPSIVGWPADQFVAVMQSYRAKERDNAVMQTIAGRFSDPELAALAAYYESLKPN